MTNITMTHSTSNFANTTIPESTSIYVPLSSLFVSPGNVRQKPTRVEELAAMIDAQGLLNPLYVTLAPAKRGSPQRYAVEAGGRRFAAMNLLIVQGKLGFDAPVEVRVIEPEKAFEISLTENVSQEPMHPADAFVAYQSMVTQGLTVEVIASKFGVKVIQVLRRLRMANVAPELFQLYRNDAMTLDQIMALATVDDHERQLGVWNSLSPHNRQSHTIKRRLTEDEIADTDVRVQAIGLENYLAAGGSVRTDLFSEEGTQYLTDPALVDRMLGEKLEAMAAVVRGEGWAWVDVFPDYGFAERQQHSRLERSYLPEYAEMTSARIPLENKYHELEAEHEKAIDAEDWDESDKLTGQMEDIEARLAALKETLLDVNAFDKTIAGAVVTMDDGDLVVHRGLERRAAKKTSQSDAADGVSPTAAKSRPDVPEKLMLNLSSHRTAAIQALMLGNQQVTLAALASKMATAIYNKYDVSNSPLKVSLAQSRATLEKNSTTLATSRAAAMLDKESESWLRRLPQDTTSWFDWLLEQPQEVVLSLIVFATANSAEAVQGRADSSDHAAAIARALSLDMADWWEPTAESYLDLVPKSKLLEAVTETAGAEVAAAMLKMKKEGAVVHAQKHLQDRRWLPAPLRAVETVSA